MSNTGASDQDIEVGFETLRLYPGATMQIQSLAYGLQAHHGVKFIGFIKDKSILVTLPFQDGKEMWMQIGHAYTLRGFNGKYAYAFTAKVIRAHTHPFPYVHFSWPHSVERKLVRHSLRVAVSLQANVSRSDSTSVVAALLDLSASGAMLDSPDTLGALGDHIQIGFAVDFAENSMNMNISATICNVHKKEDGTGFHTGLVFKDVSQNDGLILHYFINSVAQGE
ncbi:MAG: hypothetical protein A3B82_03650 [Methylophilales bacterium RIFCSPHIGHO2_02_FULL_57_10]|nr:MAG: hypothetical protein A3B82_03650 [Methylophilales bacterium RIFCSPHIGHO2_02_FULL_57_10]